MELTQVKSSFFGYKKEDVVRYISELNELHTAALSAKTEEFVELKTRSEKRIISAMAQNKALEEKIASLEESIEQITAQLNSSKSEYDSVSKAYEDLKLETKDLRDKSEIISTAILNAEKCAGELMGKAREDADDMIRNAEDKVRYEKDKLNKAKDYVRSAREELRITMKEIEAALTNAESELEAKVKSVDNGEAKSAEKKVDISLFKRA